MHKYFNAELLKFTLNFRISENTNKKFKRFFPRYTKTRNQCRILFGGIDNWKPGNYSIYVLQKTAATQQNGGLSCEKNWCFPRGYFPKAAGETEKQTQRWTTLAVWRACIDLQEAYLRVLSNFLLDCETAPTAVFILVCFSCGIALPMLQQREEMKRVLGRTYL